LSDTQKKYRVQINYKSGASQTLWFTKMNTKSNGGKLTAIEWCLSPDEVIRVHHLGIDDIESIFELWSVEC